MSKVTISTGNNTGAPDGTALETFAMADGGLGGYTAIVDPANPTRTLTPAADGSIPVTNALGATGAKQDTGNTSLASLDAKNPALVAGRVPVDPSGVTSPVSIAATVAVSAASLPLPAGAASAAKQDTGNTSIASVDTKTPALGQALAAASVPVVLTAAQQAALTPPAAITGFALEAGHLATIDTSTAKIPAQGQALAAASLPVVLPALQVAALTPPTNTGYALDGTDITTPTAMPTGGVGIRGWLSAIWTKLNATLTVSGTVTANTGLAQPLTDTQLRAAAVPVSNAALPLPTGASTEATLALIKAKTDNLDVALSTRSKPADQQHVIVDSSASLPVTGPVTDTQLRASAVPVSGPATDAQLRASALPVSVASLPLPSGAATEATLDARSGSLTETAPTTDTASSGLNGRLQRIAQRVTSLIALLPVSLAAGGGLKVEGVAGGVAQPVTQKAATSTSGTLQSAAAATGNGTLLPVDGMSAAIFTVSGSFVGTITWEGTEDGSTFASLNAIQLGTNTIGTTATAGGLYELPVAGLVSIRARISAYTSGSITVTGHADPVTYAPKVVNTNVVGTVPVSVAAQTLKGKFGTSNQTVTITVASLANNAARASTALDLSSLLFFDDAIFFKIKSPASSTLSTGVVNIYAVGTADGGTTYGEGATGTDAAITLTSPTNARFIGALNVVANATTYYGMFYLSPAFSGNLPEKVVIIIENKTGGTLDTTAGNHGVWHQGVLAQSV